MGGARTRPRASGRRSCDSEEKRFAVNTETRMGWVGCFNGPQQRNGEKRSRHDEVLEAKEQPAGLGGEPAGQLGLARPGRPGNPDLSGNECRGRHVSALSALAVGARGARTGEEEKRRRGERRRRRRGEERTRRGQEKEDKSTRGQENRREEKRGENEMTKACGGPQGTGEGGGLTTTTLARLSECGASGASRLHHSRISPTCPPPCRIRLAQPQQTLGWLPPRTPRRSAHSR